MLQTLDTRLVSDSPMWKHLLSNYNFALLITCDQLGVFGLIEGGEHTFSTLSSTLKLNEKGVTAVILVLKCLGYVDFEHGKIVNTDLTKTYLLPDSHFYWGDVLKDDLNIYHMTTLQDRILDSLKDEHNLECDGHSVTEMWEEEKMSQPVADAFTRLMHNHIFATAVYSMNQGIYESVDRLLDAGGGSGAFSIAFCKKYPDKTSAILELDTVCKEAEKYIRRYQCENQIKTISGNFFHEENWPDGYDAINFSNVFHDWQPVQCLRLAQIAFNKLPNGGRIFLHEMLLNEEGDGPLNAVLFNLHMFINHKSQQFTQKQLYDMLESVGFVDCTTQHSLGDYSVISAVKP